MLARMHVILKRCIQPPLMDYPKVSTLTLEAHLLAAFAGPALELLQSFSGRKQTPATEAILCRVSQSACSRGAASILFRIEANSGN